MPFCSCDNDGVRHSAQQGQLDGCRSAHRDGQLNCRSLVLSIGLSVAIPQNMAGAANRNEPNIRVGMTHRFRIRVLEDTIRASRPACLKFNSDIGSAAAAPSAPCVSTVVSATSTTLVSIQTYARPGPVGVRRGWRAAGTTLRLVLVVIHPGTAASRYPNHVNAPTLLGWPH